MKKILKKLLSGTRFAKSTYLKFLIKYDYNRFVKHSGFTKENQEYVAAHIRILTHTLEKALSLKNVRAGFGKQKVEALIALYEQYSAVDDKKDLQALSMAQAILAKYIEFQKDNMDLSFIPKKFFNVSTTIPTGAFELSKEDYLKNNSFEAVAHARHSIRDYEDKPIDRETRINAIALAQTAPSACNRQSTRIYICENREKISSIISKHGGFNGFENVGVIIAITGDLTLYSNALERNTVYVDGGIFAMNMLYSLQHYEIGSCPIIWASEPDNDAFLHNLLSIPQNESVICLIAAGYYPENGAKAAVSLKRNTNDIVKFI